MYEGTRMKVSPVVYLYIRYYDIHHPGAELQRWMVDLNVTNVEMERMQPEEHERERLRRGSSVGVPSLAWRHNVVASE